MQPTHQLERGVQMVVILGLIFPCKCGRVQGWHLSQFVAETVIGAVVDPAITSSDPKKETESVPFYSCLKPITHFHSIRDSTLFRPG
jgi:hypothetical protein